MNDGDNGFDVVKHIYEGIWGSESHKKLCSIGVELYKVHKYASKYDVDDDLLALSIIRMAQNSYFSGVCPLMRIEQSLFIANDFRNEYMYALSCRAYVEVAGRLHKGVKLWRQYRAGNKTIEETHKGMGRLLSRYRRNDDERKGLLSVRDSSGMTLDGYNVMTFVQALKDNIHDIENIYDRLSNYVHGDFGEQMITRKISWLYDMRGDGNPVMKSHEELAANLRSITFDDFDFLLQETKGFRDKYDNDNKS